MTRRAYIHVPIALGVALILAGTSSARPRGGAPDFHREPGSLIEQHAEALGIDDATLAEIHTIAEDARGEGRALHKELHELRSEMKALLSADTPDKAAVMQQADRIGAAETALHKHRLGTMLDIRALLTPEQREALAELRSEARGRWHEARRRACASDLESLCPDASDRWSRRQCLREHREELSAACREAIGPGPQRRPHP